MKLNHQYYIEPRSGKNHISLDGEWDYAYLDNATDDIGSIDWKLKTKIPSSTYRSLAGSGILPDPYKGTNCCLYDWVDEKVWYYRRSFQGISHGKKAFLCFDGVSYYARIWLNGQLLGEHDGMFGGPIVEVSELLCDENELIVEVKAPNWGQKESWQTFNANKEQSAIVPWGLSRCSFLSDGKFIAFGIWRSVRLELVETCHLSRPYLTTEEIGSDFAKLHLSCEVVPAELDELHCVNTDFINESPQNLNGYIYAANGGLNITVRESVDIRIKIDDGDVKYDETFPFDICDPVGYNRKFLEPNFLEKDIIIRAPKLWNPVGLGKPELCHLTLELYSNGKLLDSQELDFGIRTVSRDYTAGRKFMARFEKFRFSVNGRDFFLRGMNWMPTDFLLDCTEEDYRWTLEAARDAGIQLLRVWSGGGVPESDVFYSLCDKYGIMVWQDHSIANMQTPNWDRSVLDSQESFNLYRLRNHPSLVIHCGGNEFSPYAYDNAASMFIIERCIKDIDPKREYVRATPDGGSAHVYRDMEPVWYRKAYRELPFLAESGIHSFTSAGTMRTLISEKEASDSFGNIFNDDFKDKHPELMIHFSEYQADRVPRMLARASHICDNHSMTLDDICEATQMASYEFYQVMIESMREKYPVCGGIMLWAYKRPFSTVGVQVMDGEGDALAPYYAVANAYSDISVSLTLNELTYAPCETIPLRASVINSSGEWLNAKLMLRIYSPSLDILLEKGISVGIDIDQRLELELGSFKLPQELRDTQFFAYLTLEADGTILNRKFYSLSCLSSMEDDKLREDFRADARPNLRYDNGPWLRDEWQSAKKARLEARLLSIESDGMFLRGEISIKNCSDAPAYPVSFSTDRDEIKTCFTDSYFLLDANEERTIGFRLKNALGKSFSLSVSAWNADKLDFARI